MELNIDTLQRYVAEGWLNWQHHPHEPLYIWNYTPATQYANHWDDITTMCRGLITDVHGHVVARPFPKFFNLGQTPATQLDVLPHEVPEITEKLDGSLGILYFVNGMPYIATRGSFESRQARWANAWLEAHRWYELTFLHEYTYLFEIIYHANRIVVDYRERDEGLYLIAVVHTDTGREDLSVPEEATRLGFPWAWVFDYSLRGALDRIAAMKDEQEGFVCRYSSGLRVKMKTAEYCRIHAIVTNVTARRIWECLVAGTPLEPILDRVPDEFYKWVVEIRDNLVTAYLERRLRALDAVNNVVCLPDRKSKAEFLTRYYPKPICDVAFMFLNGKTDVAEALIWKQLRPAHIRPFQEE